MARWTGVIVLFINRIGIDKEVKQIIVEKWVYCYAIFGELFGALNAVLHIYEDNVVMWKRICLPDSLS